MRGIISLNDATHLVFINRQQYSTSKQNSVHYIFISLTFSEPHPLSLLQRAILLPTFFSRPVFLSVLFLKKRIGYKYDDLSIYRIDNRQIYFLNLKRIPLYFSSIMNLLYTTDTVLLASSSNTRCFSSFFCYCTILCKTDYRRRRARSSQVLQFLSLPRVLFVYVVVLFLLPPLFFFLFVIISYVYILLLFIIFALSLVINDCRRFNNCRSLLSLSLSLLDKND